MKPEGFQDTFARIQSEVGATAARGYLWKHRREILAVIEAAELVADGGKVVNGGVLIDTGDGTDLQITLAKLDASA